MQTFSGSDSAVMKSFTIEKHADFLLSSLLAQSNILRLFGNRICCQIC